MAAGKSLEPFLEAMPDEWYDWVKPTSNQLKADFAAVHVECQTTFQDAGDRQTNAL